MKKYSKIVATGVISAMLLTPISSYCASEGGLDIFLVKVSSMNPLMKEIGIGMLKDSLDKGDSGIEELKTNVDVFIRDKDKEELAKKGYTVDDLKEEIDGLKSWSKSDKDSLIDYIKQGDAKKIGEIIEKNRGTSSSEESNNSTDQSSGNSSGNSNNNNNTSNNNSSNNTNTNDNTSNNNNTNENNSSVEFKDIEGHWAKNSIIFLSQKGIVQGKGNGNFDPQGKVTRAEFTALISRLFNLKPQTQNDIKFKDVQKGTWYYDSIKLAFDNGLVNGIDENTFKPNDNISREEMVTIVMRILEKEDKISKFSEVNNSIENFTDKENVSAWAKDGFTKAIKHGILNGKDKDKLAPKDATTRAEAATLIYKIYMGL